MWISISKKILKSSLPSFSWPRKLFCVIFFSIPIPLQQRRQILPRCFYFFGFFLLTFLQKDVLFLSKFACWLRPLASSVQFPEFGRKSSKPWNTFFFSNFCKNGCFLVKPTSGTYLMEKFIYILCCGMVKLNLVKPCKAFGLPP